MSNIDSPAGSTGGPVTVPALDDLPEKMRVHALAKLLGRTSREVLGALADLGVDARSAQSSIDRKAAEQVVTALQPGAAAAEPAAAPEALAAPEPTPQAEPAQPAALAPVFAPPTPLFQEPTRPTRRRKAAVAEPAEPVAAAEPEPGIQDAEPPTPTGRRARTRRGARATEPVSSPEPEEIVEPPVVDEADDTESGETDVDGDDESGTRRRRRRGRRGRGRGRGGEGDLGDESDESGQPEGEDDESGHDGDDAESSSEDAESDGDDESESDGEAVGSRRRRRRRRRKGADDADSNDDPPGTVTRVRAPRSERDDEGDGVQSVRGSTRLEAKRQRRRDGRDAGRRRVPILSEAEFLARREAVDRSMVVRERGDRIEMAVLEDDVLVEHFVAGRDGGSMVGNIYLGRVQNVLPSMEAAFVDIGRGRNAVLYAGEVDWDAAGLGGKARRIEQALQSGDSVLVQVTKDPIGHKGARLTTQISLAGRFLVYVPSGGAAGISRKLPDVERKRLKDMLKEIVPSDAGVIIRTASEGVSHEALERDVRRLQAQWEVVKTRSEQTGPNKPKAPTLLYEEPDLLIKVVRDQFNEDFSRLVVEGDEAWETLQNYVGHVAPELGERLHRHVGTTDVFAAYRIDEQLLKALDRKVWLPSGGTLVIDRTEAMTVIDVNTGKFTGSGGNLEETVTRNNLEAAEEVVRQLRLRDIGGIIVIDFIDMVLEANRDLVLRRLTECLARDRTRHQVAEVTSLGLVQMTRKRVGGGLLEHFSTQCEHCRGRGVIVTPEPVVEKADPERSGRAGGEGGGRRSRGRRRGEGEQERNGHDARRDESAQNGSAQNGSTQNGEVAHKETAQKETAPPLGGMVPRNRPSDAPSETEPSETVEVEAADAAVAVGAGEVEAAPSSVVVETRPEPQRETADVAADAVEEVVVERDVARHAEPVAETVGASAPAPVEEQVLEPVVEPEQVESPRPARRRGRVTRSAGAPDVAAGAPAAVVLTVPVDPDVASATPAAPLSVTPPPVAPQPEPVATTRPRRARRAASRPAGPPAPETAPDNAADNATDNAVTSDDVTSAASSPEGGDPV
ncbi:translation initiation factor IF-2 N-terminal domain-containing protein [Pseudonocardia sp. TRM90224]|uniref:translation initiation factor IF-2 N-terminal domain-containing protein n=1 Tax=Pseudonocardia sp. TRM90224 TaxID=2812678 RepID=UPI001E2CBD7A|nr:translation initiation factor IF-2 N-terminal domain-containing protein [Pseudonocardia sp. TRM90224]